MRIGPAGAHDIGAGTHPKRVVFAEVEPVLAVLADSPFVQGRRDFGNGLIIDDKIHPAEKETERQER